MYDIVAIGDVTVDVYFQGKDLTCEENRFMLARGGKYYADYFHQCIGGSAANVSIHASNLGYNSSVLAKVGENSFKNTIIQGLVRKNVSTEFLFFEKNHMSISSILLSETGERTIIKYSDPKDEIIVADQGIERIRKSKVIFMGNLPDVHYAKRATLLSKMSCDDNIIALNLGSKDCAKGVRELSDLIKKANILILNRFEFSELTKQDPNKIDLSKDQHKKIGGDILIVITDGEHGSFAYSQSDSYFQKAEKIEKIVDSTGAGDSFSSAFLMEYQETKNIQEALRKGSHYASKIVMMIGAN